MHCLLNPGAKVVCIREVQKTLNQSAKALIESKIQEFGVGSQFRVLYDRIETPGNGLIIFQGMQDMNAESIKSLEGYNMGGRGSDPLSEKPSPSPTDHPGRRKRAVVHLEPPSQVIG